MHYLPLVGMIILAAGIAGFAVEVPSSQAVTLVCSGLTGIGLGATVSPALCVAGFSLPSANLQRVFAIVELLRAVPAFMIAPVFIFFAATVGSDIYEGTRVALWIGFGLAIGGAVVGAGLYALSGACPQKPDLPGFLAGEKAAWYSPPLLARLRADVNHSPHRSRSGQLTGCNPTSRTSRQRVRSFGYDGSDLVQQAIRQAARELASGRRALSLCVWQPADGGFVPVGEQHFDALNGAEVRAAAEQRR